MSRAYLGDRRLWGKLGVLHELEWQADSQNRLSLSVLSFYANSSFASPSSDHATFSKDFGLRHLWTMRSVTTNGQALELESFLRWKTYELVKRKKYEPQAWRNRRLANQNVSHFLLISHDRVAFDLVKNRSQAEAEELIKEQQGNNAQYRLSREQTKRNLIKSATTAVTQISHDQSWWSIYQSINQSINQSIYLSNISNISIYLSI